MFSSALRAAFVALALSALPVMAVPALSYQIANAKTADGVDNMSLKLTLKNNGNETVTLLNDPRGTLSKLPTNAFIITNDKTGQSPDFYGVKVKYVPSVAAKAGKEALTVIKPGETFEISHNLAEAYNFTSTGEGSYTVEPSAFFQYLDESGAPTAVRAPAASSKLTLTGSLISASSARTIGKDVSSKVTYGGCSVKRRETIIKAGTQAMTLTNAAYFKLKSASVNTLRYRTWFGKYSSVRRNHVYSHFSLMRQSGFGNFKYDCSTCTDAGTFAYVYPSDPSTIYLCPAFWTASLMGTDSQSGTLIHESSHFRRHGGTQDHVYGQTGAKELAITDPAKAIFNADSHEYYAENTPALP